MSTYIVVQRGRSSMDRRQRVFAYHRKGGPPRTLVSVSAKAARMTKEEAASLAAEMSVKFPRWEWVAMREEDF